MLFVPFLLFALRNSEYLEKFFGDTINNFWEFFSVCISFLGFAIRCFTVGFVPSGTSGRNTKMQAAEKLNTTGMYSIVRNPLYLGNFIIILGIALFIQVWWLALNVFLVFWIYYERIIFAEEEFLRKKFGNSFLEWAHRTPVFLPNFRNWEKPGLPFSLKMVLRKELSTFFAIVASFTFLDIASDWFAEGKLELSLPWIIFFIISLVVYLTLIVLKKRTKVLNVKDR